MLKLHHNNDTNKKKNLKAVRKYAGYTKSLKWVSCICNEIKISQLHAICAKWKLFPLNQMPTSID